MEDVGLVPWDKGSQIYQRFSQAAGDQQYASKALLEAGIPGIKYLEGASRAKGKGDYNYVIFDEGAVTITEKMFMPAEQAGAPKGKNVEAARLWEKKGGKSPYFKKWFGKSKVVDENGDPQVVYHHGSFDVGAGDSVFNEWTHFGTKKAALDRAEQRVHSGLMQDAHKEVKGGGALTPVYLNLKNPVRLPDMGMTGNRWRTHEVASALADRKKVNLKDTVRLMDNDYSLKTLTSILKDKGYDGIVYKNMAEDRGKDSYVAFEPTQIKSATGAKGTFDPSDPNIMHMPAGKAGKGGQVTSQPRGGSAYFPKTTQRERKELQPR